MTTYTVPLSQLVEEFGLEAVWKSDDFDKIQLSSADLNRPAIQLTGYYEYFTPQRLQIIGFVEMTYLNKLSGQDRYEAYANLFMRGIPAFIVAQNMEPHKECLEAAKKYNVTVLKSAAATSSISNDLVAALKLYLSPSITRHGVFVEVYGEGVLLLGESGVGKSETAIELVKRGHRLVADDAVELKRDTAHSLVGSAPELIRHYIEIRGIGIIDVRQLFGMGAVKEDNGLDLIINIELWDDTAQYDRLGIDNNYTTILGVDIPTIILPVKPGRNLAVIIEVAAMNNRQKKLGYNAALEFTNQINRHFDKVLAENNEDA